MQRRFSLCFLLLLTLLSGCAAWREGFDLEQPRVDLVDLRVLDMGLMQQRYAVVLNVQNPNSREIPVQGLSYQLKLAGEPFAHGVSAKSFTLPAYGETQLEVELTTNLVTTVRRVQALLENDEQSLSYDFSGKIDVARIGKIPFQNEGELSLRGR